MAVKFMSPEQIAANQKNAQKTTGPTTPEGKEKASRNSIKHGLLAKSVVIDSPYCTEQRADFDALLADLCEELQPRGFIEQTLVERIATCYWRLHRAQCFESGKVRETLETTEAANEEIDKIPQQLAKDRADLKVIDRLVELLARKTEELAPLEISEVHDLIRRLPEFGFAETMHQVYGVTQMYDPNEVRNRLHGIRRVRLERIPVLEEKAKHAEELRALRRSRTSMVGSLPSDGALLNVIRYETMIDRQLHRALTELRRYRERRDLLDSP